MSARRLLLLCCLLLAPALAAADDVAWSNKWRLQFSGAAESAGEIVLEVRDRAGRRPLRGDGTDRGQRR